MVSRWQAIQVEIEKERQLARHGSFHGHHCYLKATIEAIEEKKRHSAEKRKLKRGLSGDADQSPKVIPSDHPFVGQPKNAASNPDSADFEEAIKTAVAATSRGNPEEDALIERAIRASVVELHNASKDGDSGDAIQRAIQASVAEAVQVRQVERTNPTADGSDGAGDHDEQLKAALLLSLQETSKSDNHQNVLANADFDDSGIDTDDDENIKAAIQRSKTLPITDPPVGSPKDEDFQKVIELSKKSQEEHDQGRSKSKTEEEIVLEYVKKQSLAEEQHKKAAAARGA